MISLNPSISSTYRRFTPRSELNGVQAVDPIATSDNGNTTSTQVAPTTTTSKTTSSPLVSSSSMSALIAAQSEISQTTSVSNFTSRSSMSTPTQTTQAVQAVSAYQSAASTGYTKKDNMYVSSSATESDFTASKNITDSLSFDPAKSGGYYAAQVNQQDADTLKKTAERNSLPITAASGNVVGLQSAGQTPSQELTFNFAFKSGKDASSFSLELDGDFDKSKVNDMLKNGQLNITMQKWGGAGNVGENASSLSLGGRQYSFADFGDGKNGLSLNVREGTDANDPSTIGGTFGGFTARSGVTMKIQSYDPSVNIQNAKMAVY